MKIPGNSCGKATEQWLSVPGPALPSQWCKSRVGKRHSHSHAHTHTVFLNYYALLIVGPSYSKYFNNMGMPGVQYPQDTMFSLIHPHSTVWWEHKNE